jgi:hypothetical protein
MMKMLLLIQCLLALASGMPPRGAITGVSHKVEAKKDRLLRGSLSTARNGRIAPQLLVSPDKKRRGR